MTTLVLNTLLSWDGSMLPYHQDIKISEKWQIDKQNYWSISFPSGYVINDTPITINSVLYGIPIVTNPELNCMIDEMKSLFNLNMRGCHLLRIKNRVYGVYYVPMSDQGNIIVETPIAKANIDMTEDLTQYIQYMFAFCELFALSGANEQHIRMRATEQGLSPVLYNGSPIVMRKPGDIVFTILAQRTHTKWFNDNCTISQIVAEMVNFHDGDELVIVLDNIRTKMTEIVLKYGKSYIWFVSFIIGRLSSLLLAL